MDFGIEGYGLYFACVEIIAGNLSRDNITFELEHDAQVLANKFKMDTLKVEKIMKTCVELGLFEFNAENGRISCNKIGKRLDTYTARVGHEMRQLSADVNTVFEECSNKVLPEEIRREEKRKDNIKDSATAETAVVPAVPMAYSCELFTVPKADLSRHKDAYPGVNVAAEYRKMSAWLSANPQKRPRNYPRFVNNWLAREQDRVAMRGSKQAPAPFRNRNVAAEQVEDMMRAGKTFDDIFPEKVK